MIKALSVFFWCIMLCLVTSRIIFQHNLFYTNKFFSGCGSLTFIHVRHAGRHSGQQQRYSTPVCSGPACELSPRCDGGSRAPLLLFGARCFWGALFIASTLVSSERLCGEMLPDSLLILYPIHLQYLRMMMASMLSRLQRVRICCLEMVLGNDIRRILLRFLEWKVDRLLRSLSVILQHSEPYSRVESTQLWYSLSLVLVLYWDKGR